MEIVIFCVVMFFAVVYGYYTVEGSGIAETPYGKIHGGAPGAIGPSSVSGRDERVSIEQLDARHALERSQDRVSSPGSRSGC